MARHDHAAAVAAAAGVIGPRQLAAFAGPQQGGQDAAALGIQGLRERGPVLGVKALVDAAGEIGGHDGWRLRWTTQSRRRAGGAHPMSCARIQRRSAARSQAWQRATGGRWAAAVGQQGDRALGGGLAQAQHGQRTGPLRQGVQARNQAHPLAGPHQAVERVGVVQGMHLVRGQAVLGQRGQDHAVGAAARQHGQPLARQVAPVQARPSGQSVSGRQHRDQLVAGDFLGLYLRRQPEVQTQAQIQGAVLQSADQLVVQDIAQLQLDVRMRGLPIGQQGAISGMVEGMQPMRTTAASACSSRCSSCAPSSKVLSIHCAWA